MSVYTRPHKRKLAKRSRTRPVYGEGTDKDKYFRCWNCGWVCNVDRDVLGDSDSNSGNEHTDYHQTHHVNTYDPPAGVLGPDLVTNGTFDSDTGWTKDAEWTIAAGVATCDGTDAGYTEILQAPKTPFEIGKTYAAFWTITGWTGGSCHVYICSGVSATAESSAWYGSNGTFVDYLRCLDNTVYTDFRFQGYDNFAANIGNVSLREVLYLPGNESRYAVLGGDTGHYQVAQNIVTPDGEAKLIRHTYTSDISRGCPFCGSTNYRGDY